MRLVKIERFENGGHCNQTVNHLSKIPDGWALIPEDMVTDNFPFGDITVEEIDGVPTVTSWVPGEIPKIPEVEEEPVVDLGDEEVPLAMLPATGDLSGLWLAMSGISAAGLFLTRKKREEDAE